MTGRGARPRYAPPNLRPAAISPELVARILALVPPKAPPAQFERDDEPSFSTMKRAKPGGNKQPNKQHTQGTSGTGRKPSSAEESTSAQWRSARVPHEQEPGAAILLPASTPEPEAIAMFPAPPPIDKPAALNPASPAAASDPAGTPAPAEAAPTPARTTPAAPTALPVQVALAAGSAPDEDARHDQQAARARRTRGRNGVRLLAQGVDPDKVSAKDVGGVANLIALKQAAAADEEQRRLADPLEQAITLMRRRGRVIYRMSVKGGRHDRWFCSGLGTDVTAEQLLAAAERYR